MYCKMPKEQLARLVVSIFIRQSNTVFKVVKLHQILFENLGHIYYFLISNDFDINLTTIIIACLQCSPSVTKKEHVNISNVNLANVYRTFNVIAIKFTFKRSLEYLKELCEYLYVLLSKRKKTQKPFQHQLLAMEELLFI